MPRRLLAPAAVLPLGPCDPVAGCPAAALPPGTAEGELLGFVALVPDGVLSEDGSLAPLELGVRRLGWRYLRREPGRGHLLMSERARLPPGVRTVRFLRSEGEAGFAQEEIELDLLRWSG